MTAGSLHSSAAEDAGVIEYIRYRIAEHRKLEFELAYATAMNLLEQSPHCLGCDVARSIQEPTSYIVRIEWDSVEGHRNGFAKSPLFPKYLAAVRPFMGDIEEMRHYERTGAVGRIGAGVG